MSVVFDEHSLGGMSSLAPAPVLTSMRPPCSAALFHSLSRRFEEPFTFTLSLSHSQGRQTAPTSRLGHMRFAADAAGKLERRGCLLS